MRRLSPKMWDVRCRTLPVRAKTARGVKERGRSPMSEGRDQSVVGRVTTQAAM